MIGYPSAEACCLGYYGEGHECEIVDKCSSSSSEGTTIATQAASTTTTTTVKPDKWWYTTSSDGRGGKCVFSNEYDDVFTTEHLSHLLYDDKDGCCANHKDISCLPAMEPKWLPQVDKSTNSMICILSSDYPPELLEYDDAVFDTEEECCAIYCMKPNSGQVDNGDATSSPTYNPTLAPDDDGPIVPKYPMFSGPCSSDSQCQDGLVCHVNSKKCICNTATNEGCSNGAICGVSENVFCPATGCIPTCHCDVNNDVGGENGCKVGQVCREPCAMADAGVMCFDDEKTRDCEQMGANMACKVNREGVIGGGCVEQVKGDIIPNLEGIGCAKGFCEDFAGNCQAELSCFIDPCEGKSCNDGQICQSNYCGGCSSRCVDDGMTENSATLAPVNKDCPRGECHNPDGVCEAEMFCAVDPCNGHECEFGEVCQTNMCGGCHPVCAVDPLYVEQPDMGDPVPTGSKAGKGTTTTSTVITTTDMETTAVTDPTSTVVKTTTAAKTTGVPPGSDCPEAKWHMSTQVGGANTCTNDGVYPAVWNGLSGFIFDSAIDCCIATFQSSCIIVDDCPDLPTTTQAPETTAETTQSPQTTTASGDAPGADCPEMKWHMSTLSGAGNTCTNDNIYPPVWDTLTNYLFASASECCKTFFGGDCKIVDHCGCSKNWHMSVTVGETETCTNDLDFPNSWRTQPHIFLFDSASACCEENYGSADCNIRDVCIDCLTTWHVNPEKPGSSW